MYKLYMEVTADNFLSLKGKFLKGKGEQKQHFYKAFILMIFGSKKLQNIREVNNIKVEQVHKAAAQTKLFCMACESYLCLRHLHNFISTFQP